MSKPKIDMIINRTRGIADFAPMAQRSPIEILKSMLTCINEGKIAEFVGELDSHFTFSDHALDLQFNEKQRLTEFLEKSRELFPDTVIEIVCAYQCGDTSIVEWKLTATENVSSGCTQLRLPISLSGVSIVQFRKQKVAHWSDCYDQLKSRRAGLAARFQEWIEL